MGSGPDPEPRARYDAAARFPVVGRYVLCDEIAAGGMATVHVGRLLGPAGFSRTVAIKRLHAQFAKDRDFVDMFLDEARIAGRIRHPNVVPILDIVVENGELLLVMEYVHGESLARLTKSSRAAGVGVPMPIALSIMSAALYGLHAAHEAKDDRGVPLDIVHRDVSPQNILVSQDGAARVVDFGVAKAAGRLQATREGALKGKLRYMAPEQATSDHVDRRTDIYAASVVLWELLTGRRLYAADGEMNLFRAVVEGTITPPSAVAPGLSGAVDALVMRGLARDPEARFATAWDMAEAAQRVAYATPGDVGAWVKEVGGEGLDARAARIVEIESSARFSFTDVDETTRTMKLERSPSAAAPPPATAPAPAADVPSQITSLNVTGAPRRARRASIALVAGAPIIVIAVAVAGLALHRSSSDPVSSTPSAVPASATAAAPAADTDVKVPAQAPPPPEASSAAPAPATASAAPPQAATAAAKATPRGARPGPRRSCNPPYTVDASGVRVPKMECL